MRSVTGFFSFCPAFQDEAIMWSQKILGKKQPVMKQNISEE
jgi:hypothetical protein